jgi:CheY-like chemotaxis protein
VNQKLTVEMLKRGGHAVEVVADGEAAVSRAMSDPQPDLILMDGNMPKVRR